MAMLLCDCNEEVLVPILMLLTLCLLFSLEKVSPKVPQPPSLPSSREI